MIIPLNNISAVICNYARPKNAQKCINQLKKLGIQEIIVWNNGGKKIRGATKTLNHSHNIGPIGKYLAGLHTKKPYILIVDDDHLITKSGLTGLRKWADKYPLVAQNGVIFKHPFNNYRRKVIYRSDTVKSPKEVDMVMPNMGMMLKTSIYRKISKHWVWKSKKAIRLKPGIFSTDLEVNGAIWFLTKKRPVVVPASPNGFRILPEEAPHKALSRQRGINKVKTRILKWLISHGWQMI